MYYSPSEWGDDYRSGFSPEDIASNAAEFGDDYMNDSTSSSDSLNNWLNGAGARNPTDPAAGTSSLPAGDPARGGGGNRGSSNVSRTKAAKKQAENWSW